MTAHRAGRRARGIYRDLDAPEGMVVLKVFDSQGRRRGRIEWDAEAAQHIDLERLEADLDRIDPPKRRLRLA